MSEARSKACKVYMKSIKKIEKAIDVAVEGGKFNVSIPTDDKTSEDENKALYTYFKELDYRVQWSGNNIEIAWDRTWEP